MSTHDDIVILERAAPAASREPALVRAEILPARGMLLLQLTAHLPERGDVPLLATPPRDEALATLHGADANASFSLGGAVLVPFANRIRGTLSGDGASIRAIVGTRTVTLPANWGGRAAGAARYAMHGLALDLPATHVERSTSAGEDRVTASIDAGDFGGHWPSRTRLIYDYALRSDAFILRVIASNTGDEVLPMGIGWHPYFALPSGDRAQARLHIPARARTLVNDYDEVLPTGEIAPVRGTPYDFTMRDGRALGDLYLDDCFVDLERDASDSVTSEIVDPEARLALRITAPSRDVRAIQVYAPPERAYVALEPQYNYADPFGAEWARDVNTGMVMLAPGEATTYEVRVEPFTPATSG
jgi:galactose mutarotase-like enzyme